LSEVTLLRFPEIFAVFFCLPASSWKSSLHSYSTLQRNQFGVYGEFCANFTKAQKLSYRLEEDQEVLKLVEVRGAGIK